MNLKFIAFFSVIFTFVKVVACPFAITNDSDTSIIVTDNDKQAVYIKPKESKMVDPTVHGWISSYIFNEKLNFFVQKKDGTFFKKYQLTEFFCIPDWKEKNKFKLSEILQFIDKPTKRLSVKKFDQHEKTPHKDVH